MGHRGAMGYEPENTLASFRKALELKVDGVEMDVYVCRTGEVVVIHDKTLERTTNGKGLVGESSLDYLKSLNAGKGEKISTLGEVLDLIDKRAVVNIELKGTDTAEPVAKIIRNYIKGEKWRPDLFWITSFDLNELKRFREREPEIKIGALVARIPRDYIDFIKNVGTDTINVSMNFIKQKFIDYAHQKGIEVFAYTANHPDDIKRVKTFGVDGIFSNFPDRI